MTSSPGIEPGPHWWKASALTGTAPSLLPIYVFITPFVWNMCENLRYESVYFKELHNEQECYWPTIYRAGTAVVSTITSIPLSVERPSSKNSLYPLNYPKLSWDDEISWDNNFQINISHLASLWGLEQLENGPLRSSNCVASVFCPNIPCQCRFLDK